ncbi:hypothetical protein BZU93_27795 [Salmonella enterica subsp. enterica]|nr:hypothetical protein [Salmonella enterica subsp. enterica serovar Enteritidis]
MKIRWLYLLVPIGGAAVAAAMGSVSFWDTAKPSILTALSVIAAGVLVRLARGLPFTNADQFTVDEARQVASAIQQSVRALRALIAVVFLTMASVIFAAPTVVALKALPIRWLFDNADAGLSGVIGFLLTYVFIRIFAVIQGDLSLVDLQSQFLVQSVERKQAERFDRARTSSGGGLIVNPEGYGKVIQ